jgi:predicted transcriptional regulator
MPRRASTRPTDTELAILRVLWKRGPSTVRDVHGELGGDQAVGYTTILKLMQIMTEKELVRRDESNRAHVYEAAVSQDRTQRHLVGDLLDRAFAGSTSQLVLQALASRPASPEELEEIRRIIESASAGDD